MTGLASLFNSGQAGVMLNVGPLVVPTSKAQYNARSVPLPPKLFSHNDQQSIWQSSSPEGSTVGWGGNIGDLAQSSNTNALFTCISITGNAVFLSGDSTLSYQVGSGGAVKINSVGSNVYGLSSVSAAMSQLVKQSSSQVLENEYNRVTARAVNSEGMISSGIAGSKSDADGNAGAYAPFTGGVGNTSLGRQLKMVARLIAARSSLGTTRQVFFVSAGGFDNHDGLISNHVSRLGDLSRAVSAFYQTTANLGVAQNVTTFTASDFGRTLASNGDGSDHGWGSHHLMVGGAVKGRAFYGTPPPVSIASTAAPEDQWHVGQGRLLPTTSVDQYAGTLAKWLGVTDAEMPGVLPKIVNFGGSANGLNYPKDLGFMA
jgi:uncharacterized protein (DUF1501 family)